MFRKALPLIAVLGVVLVLAPVAAARGHIDPSFGKNGVVDLTPDVTEGSSLGAFVVAPRGGGIFFTEQRSVCYRGGCPYALYLKRYGPNGGLDYGFGDGGRAQISSDSRSSGVLAIDGSGRPLVAWEERGRGILVRRLHRDGTPDASFGGGGPVFLGCGDCYLSSLSVTPAGGVLVAASSDPRPYRGDKWLFARLRANGSRDSSFGGDGLVRIATRGYGPASAESAPGGSALLFGRRCCGEPSPPFIGRLAPRGRLDQRFAVRTRRSFHGLPGTREDDFSWTGMTMIQRGSGRIELYGTTYDTGVAIGLRRDGRRDPSFGHNGFRTISLESIGATPDGSGGTFVVGYRRGNYEVVRLRPDGRFDRRFGRITLPRAYSEEGLDIAAQGRGRAIVYNPDFETCRQACPVEPKLFRVVR